MPICPFVQHLLVSGTVLGLCPHGSYNLEGEIDNKHNCKNYVKYYKRKEYIIEVFEQMWKVKQNSLRKQFELQCKRGATIRYVLGQEWGSWHSGQKPQGKDWK